jgi:hypothetical protein
MCWMTGVLCAKACSYFIVATGSGSSGFAYALIYRNWCNTSRIVGKKSICILLKFQLWHDPSQLAPCAQTKLILQNYEGDSEMKSKTIVSMTVDICISYWHNKLCIMIKLLCLQCSWINAIFLLKFIFYILTLALNSNFIVTYVICMCITLCKKYLNMEYIYSKNNLKISSYKYLEKWCFSLFLFRLRLFNLLCHPWFIYQWTANPTSHVNTFRYNTSYYMHFP